MLRILMLAAFVAFCSTAFVAGNLWAGGENSNTGTKKYRKKHEKKSFNNLAKMLKSSKKSSDSSSVGSKSSALYQRTAIVARHQRRP